MMRLFKKEDGSISTLKNIHAGKRCFIVGNGPSLKMEDLDKIKDEISFGVNRIYLSFDKTKWRPTYYAIQDSKMIEQYASEIDTLDIKYKFIPKHLKNKFNNKKGTVYCYNYQLRLYDGSDPEFSEDPSKCTYEGGTVTYLCIQLAAYMGFSEIILLGNDFSYSIEKNKDGIIVNNVKDYFVDNYIGTTESRFYPRLDLCENAFNCAKNYADTHNISIKNATRGGKLEVFERISFDSLFE